MASRSVPKRSKECKHRGSVKLWCGKLDFTTFGLQVMKQLRVFFWVVMFSAGSLCYGQYSVSGYLDTPEKNKTVYLSLLRYDEQYLVSKAQILSSTQTDSTGYFNFKGKLLADAPSLYRVHTRVDESKGVNQLADKEDLKNFHNFVFTNQDTIVFEKNKTFWFSSGVNTNRVDAEWRSFSSYAAKLRQEFSGVSDQDLKNQSASQFLSELKSYAKDRSVHPLVTLLLLSGVQEETLKADFDLDAGFYTELEKELSSVYGNSSYAEQYSELLGQLSISDTQLQLNRYQRFTYLLLVICLLLIAAVTFLGLRLRQYRQAMVQPQHLSLTNQEERIAQLIAQEKTNKEIAAELFISHSTVKTHIRNLYAKLEVNSRQAFIEKLKNHPPD
jgi:DNA-binding CsgD family transcriptional regulator